MFHTPVPDQIVTQAAKRTIVDVRGHQLQSVQCREKYSGWFSRCSGWWPISCFLSGGPAPRRSLSFSRPGGSPTAATGSRRLGESVILQSPILNPWLSCLSPKIPTSAKTGQKWGTRPSEASEKNKIKIPHSSRKERGLMGHPMPIRSPLVSHTRSSTTVAPAPPSFCGGSVTVST